MCGLCGDAYDMPQPRPNEMGGEFGLGVLSANLTMDSVMEVEVELPAYHKGFFEIRLCPHNRRDRPVTQTCLDEHLLSLESGGQKYYPDPPRHIDFRGALFLCYANACCMLILAAHLKKLCVEKVTFKVNVKVR